MRLFHVYFVSFFCESIVFSYQLVSDRHNIRHSGRSDVDSERFHSKKHRRLRSQKALDEPLVQIDLANFIQSPDDQVDYSQAPQEKSDFNENNEITKLIDKFLKKNSDVLTTVEDINKELEQSVADVDNANQNFKCQDEMKKKRVDNNYFNKLKMRHAPEKRIRMRFPFSAFKDNSNLKKRRNKRLFGFNFNKKHGCGSTTTTSPCISASDCESTKNPCTSTKLPCKSYLTQKATKLPKKICKLKRSYIERLCPSCGRKFIIANFNNNNNVESVLRNPGSQSQTVDNNIEYE